MRSNPPEPDAGVVEAAPAPADRTPPVRSPAPPAFRRLRAFAFDPLLGNQLDTLEINAVTLPVPWEDDLGPGPAGEYLEVVDVDPAGDCFYAPVDLNDRNLLATDGLPPSEGNPAFHQQMVYAVAMTTIRHFERALGRRAQWAAPGGRYVPRLRVYPHALREANAYYSPAKVALLFGYFPAPASAGGRNLPGGTVFTCLSHDVVAHETAHALLDGMHGRFAEPTNPDVLAFHEAFADLVALFQHFTFPAVLRHQIGRTRGDLASQNLLGELAQQFGEGVGRYGALRSALGTIDPATGRWHAAAPDPAAYARTAEPHDRGAILVAAVFDAFLAIYKSRIADLLRIATNGSGVLPAGDLHPDLVNRLAREAAKSAGHVLSMCIAALDYCPPVDITFGDYLRALITADADLVKDDDLGYRVAMVEAFRRRGIYPPNVRSLAHDSLVWTTTDEHEHVFRTEGGGGPDLRPHADRVMNLFTQWNLLPDRRAAFDHTRAARRVVGDWLAAARATPGRARALEAMTGLGLTARALPSLRRGPGGLPDVEVHAVRPAQRVGPDGQLSQIITVELTQDRPGYFDPDAQRRSDRGDPVSGGPEFTFAGGCTLVFDVDDLSERQDNVLPLYAIRKDVQTGARLSRERAFRGRPAGSLGATYFARGPRGERFAALHRGE